MAHRCSRSVKALPACALPPPTGAPRSQVEKLQLLAGTVRPNTRRKGADAASALIPSSPSGRPTGSSLSRGKKELPPPPHSQRAPKPSPAHSGIRDSGPPGTAHRSPSCLGQPPTRASPAPGALVHDPDTSLALPEARAVSARVSMAALGVLLGPSKHGTGGPDGRVGT